MDPLLLGNGIALAEQQLDQTLLDIQIQIGLIPLTVQIDIAFVVAGGKHQVMVGIPQGKGEIIATELLSGDKECITFNANQCVLTDIPAYSGKILKIKL